MVTVEVVGKGKSYLSADTIWFFPSLSIVCPWCTKLSVYVSLCLWFLFLVA
ncbi:rCG44535 [Rattus norvegicus]|uniref:RCG44535 n=1 Tax=Rattus norvegicus TaxID=10116 RepID=A6I4F0_RAT|nr:rCG44535 [Rattus norvegicus]